MQTEGQQATEDVQVGGLFWCTCKTKPQHLESVWFVYCNFMYLSFDKVYNVLS